MDEKANGILRAASLVTSKSSDTEYLLKLNVRNEYRLQTGKFVLSTSRVENRVLEWSFRKSNKMVLKLWKK